MSADHNPSSRTRRRRIGGALTARLPRWPILALALVIGIALGIVLPERPVEHRLALPQAQIAVPPPAETVPVAPPVPAPELPPVPEASPAMPSSPTESVSPPERVEALPEPAAAPGDGVVAPSEEPGASSGSPPLPPPDLAHSGPAPAPQAAAPPLPGASEVPAPNLPPEQSAVAPPSAPPAAMPSQEIPPPVAAPSVAPPPPAAKPPAVVPPSEPASVPSTLPRSSDEPPAWRRHAVAAPAVAGRPMVAVIIDDMGLDARRSRLMMELPGPLTMSFIPYARDLDRQTAAARGFGHELMVHVSMQPLNAAIDPGPNALMVEQEAAEMRRRLVWALDSFGGYVGINNHMGSRFTTHRPGMTVVMRELKARGLLFVDSRTVPHSLGGTVAAEFGVPHAGRSLFIDNVLTADAVMKELIEIEQIARRAQVAIAIGHPHDATLAALKDWLPTLAEKGIALVPVSAIVARQEARRARGAAKSSASP